MLSATWEGLPIPSLSGRLRLFIVPTIVLVLTANFGEAAPRQSNDLNEPQANTNGKTCPPDTVCLAIPGFHASTGYPANKEKIFSAAVPDILKVALLRYPGIQLISNEDLWQAIRVTYESPKDWKPAKLSDVEVLRRAGANYVLKGLLYERFGTIQLTGGITSLIEGDRWRSQNLRSGVFPERQLFDGVSSFAAEIVQVLAKNKKLNYRIRLFVTSPFCDASQPKFHRSALYASDLPKALTKRALSIDAVRMEFLEHKGCITKEDAAKFAQSKRADGVVTGVIKLSESDGSIVLETQVFLPEMGIWQKIPLMHDAGDSYLEQKYVLLDRFEQFLKAALTGNGQWERDVLETPRFLPDLLNEVDQFIEQSKLSAAGFLLLEALSIDPSSAEVHYRIGLVDFQQGRLEQAIDHQREALRERPDFPDAYRALGDALIAVKDYEGAEKAYGKLVGLKSDPVDAYLGLGNVAIFQGKPEKAIEQYHQVLRIDPKNLFARDRLANLYQDRAQNHFRDKRYLESYNDYHLALESDPSPNADRYFYRALTFARSVRFGELVSQNGYQPAIEDYRKALEIFKNGQDPTFSRAGAAYANIPELYLLEDDYVNTIKSAQEYLDLDASEIRRRPDDELVAHFFIVVALILANRPHEEALEHLEAQINSRKGPRFSGWSFDLLDKYLDEKQPPLSEEQSTKIKDIKAKLEAKLKIQ